ncbi:MAG TPA: NADH-quinone oxidoreductase subunit NuoG [Rhodanobacteraceae bacterium]|nr:NADH-quinone oxidoreductase subunit NuoG [Rhodanobacteraceae bacterium]
MSAQPKDTKPAVPMVEFEIDGHPVRAPKGSMIIQAADAAGIPIPRFCYHKKLPIAAVCRQCMVEVEMGGRIIPKPQVACATPVAQGMKVFTRTERAIHAQQNALEFVLINHPLDCPICDQGGECELQDLAMGYGRQVSRFTERKRTITDENVGPLVATEMTRCIHCTRCVRFLGEVAGSYEFGDFDRGDRHVIGTWVGRGIGSELSGNVIDVCPVGALTDKVYQFKARAWELIAKPSMCYHDALGANLWLHTKRGQVLRAVPRDNEAINECWLADRDRYSHEGLYADDRAQKPLIRKGGELVEVDWDEAIAFVADGLRQAGGDVAALLAPLASCEEGWLLAQLVHGLGSERVDHRLRVQDFSDGGPAGATFEMPVDEVPEIRAGLIVGSYLRLEVPLLNQRVRRSTRHDASRPHVANMANYDISTIHGAAIHVLNPVHFDFHFDLASETVVPPQDLAAALAALAAAAGVAASDLPAPLGELVARAQPDETARAVVKSLREAASSVVILGDIATQHPQASWLRALTRAIAHATGSAFDELPSGANAVGLARVGAQSSGPANSAQAIVAAPPKALVTWQAGAQDTAQPAAYDHARAAADFHVYIGAYACKGARRTAAAILPIGLPPEVDGTYVNVDGHAQMVAAGAVLPGDARPGWKVLRALGGALGVPGFDFVDLEAVHARIAEHIATPVAPESQQSVAAVATPAPGQLVRLGTVGVYRSDAVVRRAKALQAHSLNRAAALRVCAADAGRLGLADGARADVDGVVLPVAIDESVAPGCAWIEAGRAELSALPPHGAALTIKAIAA